MTRLTEEMVIARTRANDLGNIRKLNVWGSGLSDVSLLRKMQNVEILALSVNKIASLADFQWCRNLQELYVRRNEIKDLNQVCYLRELPRLRSLWLEENPCATCDLYRATVLRTLPHLQKLDNVPVAPEEVQEALRRGLELCHPEDARAGETLQSHGPVRHEEHELGPCYEDDEDTAPTRRRAQPGLAQQRSPPRRRAPSDPDSDPEAQQRAGRRLAPGDLCNANYDAAYEAPYDAHYDAHYDARYDADATGYGRAINNQYLNIIYDRAPLADAGESPSPADELSSSLVSPGGSSLHSHTPSKDTTPGSEDSGHGPGAGAGAGRADACSSDSSASGGNGGGGGLHLTGRRGMAYSAVDPAADGDGDQRGRRPPAQLHLASRQSQSSQSQSQPQPQSQAQAQAHAQPPPSARRPVPRVWNSNILSAVLCLIKELDFPSLEVVELAVRSRMEEF